MCVCLFDFYYTAQIDPQEASSGKCGGQIKNPNQMVSNHVNSFEGFLLNTSYLTDSYIGLKYPQYGICIQKYNFWPRNDGEKWPRKICFEIPPWGKISIFITEFVILDTLHRGISKTFFLDHFLLSFLGQKLCFLILIEFRGKKQFVNQFR